MAEQLETVDHLLVQLQLPGGLRENPFIPVEDVFQIPILGVENELPLSCFHGDAAGSGGERDRYGAERKKITHH